MAAYFIDLDGTFFVFPTQDPVKNAVETVRRLASEGHDIIFTTLRMRNDPRLGETATLRRLAELGVPYKDILWHVKSPRIVVNDDGAFAFNHPRDTPLLYDRLRVKDVVRRKAEAALGMLAWIGLRYYVINPEFIDADDYIQTMLILESLLDHGGVNHTDLVLRYRQGRRTSINGNDIPKNGALHLGQLHKLRESKDPGYVDAGGITTGACMKVFGLAAYYPEFTELVNATNRVIRITHGSVEARLSAVLVALRYRHALTDIDDPDLLLLDFSRAARTLGFAETDAFKMVLRTATRAREIIRVRPDHVFERLVKEVGLMYLCWSCPVSAVFWSYVLDDHYKGSFETIGSDKQFKPDGKLILVDDAVKKEYLDYIIRTNQKEFVQSYVWEYNEQGRQDSDTFFSIAFSIRACRHPEFLSPGELEEARAAFGDDWTPTIKRLISRLYW
jgi:hypothetical protein